VVNSHLTVAGTGDRFRAGTKEPRRLASLFEVNSAPQSFLLLLSHFVSVLGGRFFYFSFLCSLLALLALPLRSFGADALHIGPLFDEFSLTLAPGHRTEALGPFYYNQEEETQSIWAVPPFFACEEDPATESVEYSFVYPVLSYARYGTQYRWQFCQLLSFAGGSTQTETVRDRFTLFPLYFQQRSSDPGQNYTAFVPIYGHLKHRLFRDDIFIILFPFYSQTRKADVVTDNYGYPVFHLRHGEKLSGWQAWPFAGHEHKEVTTRTNGFNEVETIGGHDKLFVLWPLFFNNYGGLGTDNPQHEEGFIPFYTSLRSPQRDSTVVIWPFFSHVDDREKKYSEWDAPWPLIEFVRGEGKTTSRVWPFFSRSHNPSIESGFYLWPFYKYNSIHADPLDHHRTRILFFLYSDGSDKNTKTGEYRRRVAFWPFFTHHREFNGNTRLQVLSVLEPFLPENENIEREYSPVYSFWRSEKNARTGTASQSLLWNLYQDETTPASKKCSLVFGLFQYQSTPEVKSMRLFYVPLTKTKAPQFSPLPETDGSSP
jgi:hypothetical protein